MVGSSCIPRRFGEFCQMDFILQKAWLDHDMGDHGRRQCSLESLKRESSFGITLKGAILVGEGH